MGRVLNGAQQPSEAFSSYPFTCLTGNSAWVDLCRYNLACQCFLPTEVPFITTDSHCYILQFSEKYIPSFLIQQENKIKKTQ